jgi:hypothetical protein
MLDIAERVAKKVRQLPVSQQQEVLSFVESLQHYGDAEVSDEDWLKFLAHSPALAFPKDEEEDIYTLEDGEPYTPSL